MKCGLCMNLKGKSCPRRVAYSERETPSDWSLVLQGPRPRETDDRVRKDPTEWRARRNSQIGRSGNALPVSFEAAEAYSTSWPCCWGPAACEVFACGVYRLVGVAFVFDRLW